MLMEEDVYGLYGLSQNLTFTQPLLLDEYIPVKKMCL